MTGVLGRHDPTVPLAFIGHGGVGTLFKSHLAAKPISRLGDQPAGGGNLFAFSLKERQQLSGWLPMEGDEAAILLAGLMGR